MLAEIFDLKRKKRMTLEEYTKKRINRIITEEFGVSDEVDKAASEIIEYIKSRQKDFPSIQSGDKIAEVKQDYFGKPITIEIKYYFFKTGEEYDYFAARNLITLWAQPFSLIEIAVCSINGRIDYSELYDSVYHEMEHAYQNRKMGKGFGSAEIYAVAMMGLSSENDAERCLAEIVYYSTRSEQDAFINGLYGQLKLQYGKESNDTTIKKSYAYNALKTLHKAKKYLKEHRVEVMPFIKRYKEINNTYDYGKFVRIANKGIGELEWKIAKLRYGFQKKFLKEAQIRTAIRPDRAKKGIKSGEYWLW